jgi:hypothetical protein
LLIEKQPPQFPIVNHKSPINNCQSPILFNRKSQINNL